MDMMEIRLEGGEFALPVEIGGGMDRKNRGWWPATRQGEGPTRKCERCGKEYEPNSRNQKYCDDCRAKRVTR
jgi:uncharacterized OB-fold protein